jgi:hypothetical protein
MPDLMGFDHLAAYLNELGPAGHDSSGMIPVSFQELESWSRMTGADVNAWEASMLIRMSRQYCGQHHGSSDPMSPPPYVDEKSEDDMVIIRERAEKKIRSLF